MSNVARAFDQHTHRGVIRSMPGPASNDRNNDAAWEVLPMGAMPPMMFQLRLHNGSSRSFAFSDLREVSCPHAGVVQLHLFAMAKLVITIEGRHLRELAGGLSCAGIRWIQESDPRSAGRPETEPEVTRITIEQVAD
ncbi:hypothetical protein [Aeoliella sp.]|uniref:hypothetical protein n=1 Tax=Aeoliella sp. TaxID=2795800 RepID=UPI003CCB81EB